MIAIHFWLQFFQFSRLFDYIFVMILELEKIIDRSINRIKSTALEKMFKQKIHTTFKTEQINFVTMIFLPNIRIEGTGCTHSSMNRFQKYIRVCLEWDWNDQICDPLIWNIFTIKRLGFIWLCVIKREASFYNRDSHTRIILFRKTRSFSVVLCCPWEFTDIWIVWMKCGTWKEVMGYGQSQVHKLTNDNL